MGGLLDKGSAPSAPDPYATAAAQTQTNDQTALYNAQLNHVNQVTPYGSSTWTTTPSSTTGGGYTMGPNGMPIYTAGSTSPPQYTQTTSLTPAAQAELDNELKQDSTLSNLGFNLADQAQSSLGSGVNTSSLPSLKGGALDVTSPSGGGMGDKGGGGTIAAPQAHPTQDGGGTMAASSSPSVGNVQSSINYSNLPSLYGANGEDAANQATVNAAYAQATSRLDPQWTNTQNQQDAQLANQGVMFGSGAYDKAQTQLSMAKNDAYNQALYSAQAAGNAEQQNLFANSLASRQQMAGEDQNQAAFQNAAQNQGFTQAQSAQAQNFGELTTSNAADNAARAQGLQEQTNLRDLPLNELNALRSSTQIQNPQFSSVPQSTAANTDLTGNIYKSSQINADNYNNQMNGLYSIAAAAAMASDRRLKRNIRRLGMTEKMRLPLYAYEYIWDLARTRVGVMADEVAKVAPHAISRTPSGYMMVNYGLIS